MPNIEKPNEKHQNEHDGTNLKGAPALGAGEEARAEGARPLPVPARESMGLSVTPHRQITRKSKKASKRAKRLPFKVTEWTALSHGIDTLDLGLGVMWGACWEELSKDLERGKQEASGWEYLKWRTLGEEQLYIYPSGKQNYRYHLLCSVGQVFIGKSDFQRGIPNVLVSLHAWRIWDIGWPECVSKVEQIFGALGGCIVNIKPSRVDLCIDFYIPGGLNADFIKEHLVSRSQLTRQYENAGKLETFYLGNGKNPIQLRIYDKTVKASKDKSLVYFWQVWDAHHHEDVWRVEFQLRRPFLKSYDINTLEDLGKKRNAIWHHLTEEWCSLRLSDDSNSSRCTVHPFWKAVQEGFPRQGDFCPLKKSDKPLQRPDLEWHVAHIAGCLTTFGATRGNLTMDATLKDFREQLYKAKSKLACDVNIKTKISTLGCAGYDYNTANRGRRGILSMEETSKDFMEKFYKAKSNIACDVSIKTKNSTLGCAGDGYNTANRGRRRKS